jgi:hypothetical protein
MIVAAQEQAGKSAVSSSCAQPKAELISFKPLDAARASIQDPL